MEDILIELLESFNCPVIRQGSLSDDEDYPPTFFTFWNNGEYEHKAYDNKTVLVEFDFDVNVYSNNPTTVYNLLEEVRRLLKANRWQTPDRGHDIGSDIDTHTGRGINVTYLKNEN